MTEKKAVFDFKGWIREHHNTPYEIRLENDDLIKLVTEYGEASIQFTVRKTLKPFIDSTLSSVPPVWPKPRPDILATLAPQAATIGVKERLVLSPTPPVECLSTLIP